MVEDAALAEAASRRLIQAKEARSESGYSFMGAEVRGSKKPDHGVLYLLDVEMVPVDA